MQPNQDYKQLLTDVIKKQIVILGPDITLSKARNVKGLVVADDGTVTSYSGSPQETTQALIDQFVQLSGLIVKKTMEPLLVAFPDGSASAAQPQPTTQVQPATTIPVQTVTPPATPATNPVADPSLLMPQPPMPVDQPAPTPQNMQPQQVVSPQPVNVPTSTPIPLIDPHQPQSSTPPATPTQTVKPTDNPLGA